MSNQAELPTVSVIMPVRQEGEQLREVIEAVTGQSYPALRQIVVAVGPSTDGTEVIARQIAARDRRVLVLESPRGTASAGLNMAIRRADSDYVVRIDGHCLVPEGYVARLVETLREVRADCVGPRLNTVGAEADATQRGIAAAMSSRFGVGGSQFRVSAKSGFVDTVPFGIYRRAVFDELGGFREELIRNQDDEMNSRLRRSGKRIYLDAGVCVDYYPRQSMRQLWRQYFEYGYWRTVAAREFNEPMQPRQLAPGALVLGLALTGGRAVAGRAGSLVGLMAAYSVVLGLLGGQTWLRTESPRVAVRSAAAGMILHLSYGLGLWRSLLGASAVECGAPAGVGLETTSGVLCQ